MNKVVAFLEKYGEWLALTVAILFLGWMVYVNVVDRSDFQVPVAGAHDPLDPGQVDPHINAGAAANLKRMLADQKVANVTRPPNAESDFTKQMGKDRAGMDVLAMTLPPAVPGMVTVEPPKKGGPTETTAVAGPIIPAPVPAGVTTGNSEMSVPPPGAPKLAAGAGPAAAPVAGNNWPVVSKQWETAEFHLRIKDLADAWTKAFADAKGEINVPREILSGTGLLWVEMRREEQLPDGTWGPAVIVPNLPLVELPQFPPAADRQSEENYWGRAEKMQEQLAHPPMYPLKHGDEWRLPSQVEKVEKGAAAPPVAGENKPMTAAEKQKAFLDKQAADKEKAKADLASRKARTAAAEAAQKAKNKPLGGGGGAAPRSIGSYAPLPPIILAAGPTGVRGDSAAERGAATPPRNGLTPPPPAKPLGTYGMDPVSRSGYPSGAKPVGGAPLAGRFNPLDLVNEKGEGQDIVLWAHDETAVPGKTYRYSMRVYMRNPLYYVSGVKTTADTKQFALVSPWSAAQVVNVPPTTTFFFAGFRAPIGNNKVTQITVDVFKRERGDWTKEQWNIAPGDAIGGVRNGIDYSTGMTLVDLRTEPRSEKDLRILLSDEAGNVEPKTFLSQVNDEWYKELQQKVKANAQAAAAGNPALVNQVGGR